MSGAILSFFGGWWARLLGLPRPRPAAVAAPQTAAAAPQPKPAALRVEADPDLLERSFRETVRNAGASPRRARATADPEVRSATLEAIGGLRQIPALQSLVEGVVRTLSRDGVDVDEVVAALQKDSSLCVRVLGMANSVVVASERRIEDLSTAVQMLGIMPVKRMAQAVFVMRDAQRLAEGLDWRHLWIHAFATAATAEELERRLRPPGSDQIYMAALLHDVGKIVLSTAAGDTYRDILVASWNGEGRLEDLEREELGVGHREAGVIFACSNNLSDMVIDAIAHHDDPAKAGTFRLEVALVALANFMSKARGLGFSGSRLDARDGEFEDHPAWLVVEEQLGWKPDVASLEEEMTPFFAALREQLHSLRDGA